MIASPSQTSEELQLADAPPHWQIVLDALVLATLAFAAFSYGATEPWSQQIVAGLVALTCVVAAIATYNSGGFRWSWAYVPVMAFVLLVVLQLVPLPASVVSVIAPNALATRATLLDDLAKLPNRMTLSLFPAATMRTLQLLLIVIATFVIVLHAYRTPAAIRRMLAIVAVVGAAVAALALYQNIFDDSRMIYGSVRASHNNGPFVHHSHFGQFMNLCVGAGLGYALVRLANLMRERMSFGELWFLLSRHKEHWPVFAAAGFVVVGALTILLSLTRGGIIALLAAGALMGALLCWRSRSGGRDKFALLTGLGVLVVATTLIIGFNSIYDRLATLKDLETAEGGRLQILSSLLQGWREHPLFGTGLGTFEFTFPQYDSSVVPYIATHAENEYGHLVMETGIFGMTCIATFLILVFRAAWSIIRTPRRSIDYAAFGLCFGLLAILIHSASDFGQHSPAIAMVTAVTCALILNLGTLVRNRKHVDLESRNPESGTRHNTGLHFVTRGLTRGPLTPGSIIATTVFIMLSITLASVAIALERPRLARRAWAEAKQTESRIYGNDQTAIRPGDHDRLVQQIRKAAVLDPTQPKYKYTRDYYAWGQVGFDNIGRHIFVANDINLGWKAKRILERLNSTRLLIPTFGPNYALAGEIHYFGLGDNETGQRLIDRALRLTPHDPFIALTSGEVALREGGREEALERFERAVKLNGGLRDEVIDICLVDMNDADTAYLFAKGDSSALHHLLRRIGEIPQFSALAERCRLDIQGLLQVRVHAAEATGYDLATMASIFASQGEHQKAIDLYYRALAQQYDQTSWRLALARSLAAVGEHAQAVQEARECLRLRPQLRAAGDLINEQVVLIRATDG